MRPGSRRWSDSPADGLAATHRVRWAELCADPAFAGHWVALDAVRYEEGIPLDGELVDSDTDLAALCARVQSADETTCAILYCDPNGGRSAIS